MMSMIHILAIFLFKQNSPTEGSMHQLKIVTLYTLYFSKFVLCLFEVYCTFKAMVSNIPVFYFVILVSQFAL